MDVNLSVWDYYPYNGEFIDPMYAPYAKSMVKSNSKEYSRAGGIKTDVKRNVSSSDCNQSNSGTEEMCPYNKWPQQATYPSIYPEHVRKGWGLKFQKKHSWYPCPYGYTDMGDGFCTPKCLEAEPVFYTDKGYVVKNTYFDGYGYSGAPNTDKYNKSVHNDDKQYSVFDQKSVNPFTGEFQTYFPSYDSKRKSKHVVMQSKLSFVY